MLHPSVLESREIDGLLNHSPNMMGSAQIDAQLRLAADFNGALVVFAFLPVVHAVR